MKGQKYLPEQNALPEEKTKQFPRQIRNRANCTKDELPRWLVVKNLPAKAGDIRDMGLVPGLEDFLEEGMATHSSILAWKIPMDRGAWWATVHEVTKSQT